METLSSIPNVDKSLLKNEILKIGAQQHQKTITYFRIRRDEIEKREIKNTFEYDSHSLSVRSEAIAEACILTDQIQLANQELDQLMRIPFYANEIHPRVEYGKVVITNKDIFFISAPIERFYVFEFPIVGLGVDSQLYMAMKGKKEGDHFKHGEIPYRIKEII
jgi:hypothetical protein